MCADRVVVSGSASGSFGEGQNTKDPKFCTKDGGSGEDERALVWMIKGTHQIYGHQYGYQYGYQHDWKVGEYDFEHDDDGDDHHDDEYEHEDFADPA